MILEKQLEVFGSRKTQDSGFCGSLEGIYKVACMPIIIEKNCEKFYVYLLTEVHGPYILYPLCTQITCKRNNAFSIVALN